MKLRDRKLETMHRKYGIATGICGNCPHFRRFQYDKTYYKCAAYGLSHSEATDWRVRWQACGLIEKDLQSGRTIVKMLEMIRENEPLDGQISIFEGGGTDE